MPNRRQFVRQTAAALLAFGLILGLLPGLAAAQDLFTREALAEEVANSQIHHREHNLLLDATLYGSGTQTRRKRNATV